MYLLCVALFKTNYVCCQQLATRAQARVVERESGEILPIEIIALWGLAAVLIPASTWRADI